MNENVMVVVYVFAGIGFLASCCLAGLGVGYWIGMGLQKLGWLR
jgi:hypothetical protein